MNSKLRPLIVLSCLMITTFSSAQTNDEDTELIRNVFDAYFDDFVARDFEGMASHYQSPLMIVPTRTIESREGIVDFFRLMPIQEGYAYSTQDEATIHRMSDALYYLDLDFSRYNEEDELVFEGNSLYFFTNASGAWKIYSIWSNGI